MTINQPRFALTRAGDTARCHLGRVLSPDGEWYSYFDEVLDILTKGRVDVVLR